MEQLTEEEINSLIELYQSGDLQEAEKKAMDLLKKFPNEVVILNILGVIQDGKGNSKQAIKTYQKALDINADSPETYYNIASVLHRYIEMKKQRKIIKRQLI